MKINNQAKLERSNTEKINKNEERVEMASVDMRYRMRRMSKKVKRFQGVLLLS
ncbi:MAG: hypothetical protein PF638_12545 [Candidatus Delongbacteria bacterium]|jgi:hypothetical protein|nr:hypothetical protein [Candidatus Delongbacteria bacterium]